MQKKLLVAAVAGALVAPAAFAQSSVTISGVFKPSWDRVSISNGIATRTGHTSQTLIRDNSSKIQFNVVEDLGSGLSAVAQLDVRFAIEGSSAISSAGNTWAGLASKSWGQLTMGMHDLHYNSGAGGAHAKGSLALYNTTLLHSIPTGGATSASQVRVANQTRTQNTIEYKSPMWGIFSLDAAYSPNGGAEADIGTTVRKGNIWHFRPKVGSGNWSAEWSTWHEKPDAQAGGIDKIRGDTLAGKMTFGAFGVGLAYDRSRLSGAGGGSIKRTAWSIPLSWTSGPHGVAFDYTVARDSDASPGADDGAKMLALSYAYSLSKRTALAVSYGKVTNKAAGVYTLFSSSAASAATHTGTINAGEDSSILSVVFNHTF